MAKFNTDARALERRIDTHTKSGARDINLWIFEHLNVRPGQTAMDLGCGIGKQTLPLAEVVGHRGRVVAVDISQDALDMLLQHAVAQRIEDRVTAMRIELDDLPRHFSGCEQFDRILGCYSLYYAKNPEVLFAFIHRVLKDDGVLFFCGPASDNNLRLKEFHYGLKREKPPAGSGAATFMELTAPQLVRRLFRSVKISAFDNPLRIDSSNALYTYWSSYNLYDEALDVSFRRAAEEYFRVNSVFETVKRVVGVRAVK